MSVFCWLERSDQVPGRRSGLREEHRLAYIVADDGWKGLDGEVNKTAERQTHVDFGCPTIETNLLVLFDPTGFDAIALSS